MVFRERIARLLKSIPNDIVQHPQPLNNCLAIYDCIAKLLGMEHGVKLIMQVPKCVVLHSAFLIFWINYSIVHRVYSHSIVAGGLLVMSRTTRLTPGTSLTMRLEMRSRTS